MTFEAPTVFGYKALSGTPFPGYAGEVRLTSAGAGTHISYTVSTTASFPLVKAPLTAVCQVLLRLLDARPERRASNRGAVMITDDFRQRRLAIIREHMDTEVTKEFDATLATFNGHPHYEDHGHGSDLRRRR